MADETFFSSHRLSDTPRRNSTINKTIVPKILGSSEKSGLFSLHIYFSRQEIIGVFDTVSSKNGKWIFISSSIFYFVVVVVVVVRLDGRISYFIFYLGSNFIFV